MPTKEIASQIAKHLRADDGRIRRAQHSHDKIVSAFLSLLRQGNINPSAEDIAKQANVGVRTVFRRFKEMELLYREVATEIQATFGAEVAKPWISEQWQQQLQEMLARKADIYERLLPYSIAGAYLRQHSSYLKAFNVRWLTIEHEIIMSIVPFTPAEEPALFHGLTVSLSNDTWIQYRQHQLLTPQQSHDTMATVMAALINTYQNK